jgi:hypothetical protein
MQSWARVRERKVPEKNVGSIIAIALAMAGLCLSAGLTAAADKSDKTPPAQMVDSGSFGVFMNGHRVATETFSIRQNNGVSLVSSEFKTEAAVDKAVQSSEWEMNDKGELLNYSWKEISPGQSRAVVLPNQDFLIERFRKSPQDKEEEQPFMLPASSSLLDDYFFVQREVLAWKFLASSCPAVPVEAACTIRRAEPACALFYVSVGRVRWSGESYDPKCGARTEPLELEG